MDFRIEPFKLARHLHYVLDAHKVPSNFNPFDLIKGLISD